MKHLILCLTYVLILGFVSVPFSLFASRWVGGQITYTCVNQNKYKFTLTYYQPCEDSLPNTSESTLHFYNTCGRTNPSPLLLRVVSASIVRHPFTFSMNTTCDVPPGNIRGYKKIVLEGETILTETCNQWLVYIQGNQRYKQIYNNLSQTDTLGFVMYALVNNQDVVCNNSPDFYSNSFQKFCAKAYSSFSISASDNENDSLSYRLIPACQRFNPNQPSRNQFDTVSYAPTYTYQQPFKTDSLNGFNFNEITGDVSLIGILNPQTSLIAIEITEHRNGIVIGKTIQEIYVEFVNCEPLPLVVADSLDTIAGIKVNGQRRLFDKTKGDRIQLCVGDTLILDFYARAYRYLEPESLKVRDSRLYASNTIELSCYYNNNKIPNASFSLEERNPSYLVQGRFSWAPTSRDTSYIPKIFTITVSENKDYMNMVNAFSFAIYVCPTVGMDVTNEEPTKNLLVYPNPSAGIIQIKIAEQSQANRFRMFDITGKCVFEQVNVFDNEKINLSHLSAGIYSIELSTANGKVKRSKLRLE